MPPATMDAFRAHGEARPDAIEQDLDGALAELRALAGLGISLDQVTAQLVEDGVRQFADAFDQLLGAVARRRRALVEGEASDRYLRLGSPELEEAFKAEMEAWREGGKIRRLWNGDKSLWSGTDEDKWLGWLRSVDEELSDCDALEDFAQGVRAGDFGDVVLLGMGGSSLGPEVLAKVFGPQPDWPRLRILDSTDPAQIKTLADTLDLTKTLFFVSSKSGGTLEPNIFMAYFFDRVAALLGPERAAAHFVAVTDPGSSLEQEAGKRQFWRIFLGAPSIGGRYSVLSKFGLAPAAAMGLDVRRLLQSTLRMERSCGPDAPPAENPGVQLGVAMGVAARNGRDKVTIIASPRLAPFGAWLEQLVAESTGKQGRGLIPLAGEPLDGPEHYGEDRFFAFLELEGDTEPGLSGAIDALEQAGHPVARIKVRDIHDIGQEFFRWEMATAVAGSVIGIDPFDQPDVEASKDKTRELTQTYETTHHFPQEEPVFRENGLAVYADPRNAAELGRHNTLAGYLKRHFERVHAGDYVALLPYVQRDAAHERTLTAMRTLIRDRTHAATCVGFGPRFQHSTGQAYKGGPNSGVFLQITCDDDADLDVPGHAYSFGVVKAAQARGDLDELFARGRRALRIHVKHVDAGLAEIAHAMETALH